MQSKGYELSAEEISKAYDEIPGEISMPSYFYPAVAEYAMSHAILPAAAAMRARGESVQVLDVGCGNGYFLERLYNLGQARGLAPAIALFGVEPSSILCGNSAARLRNMATIKQGSVYRLPFPDGVLDVAIMTEVLEHLQDPVEALREVSRVLKPARTSKLVITVPNASSFGGPVIWAAEKFMKRGSVGQLQLLPWEHPWRSVQPIDTMYYYGEIKKLFKRAGISIRSMQGNEFLPIPLYAGYRGVGKYVRYVDPPLSKVLRALRVHRLAYRLFVVGTPRSAM